MAGLELVAGVDRVLNVRSGEMLTLEDAALDDLAEAREALTALWHERTTAAMMIDAELVRRADLALAEHGDEYEWGKGARFRVYVDRGGAMQIDANALRNDLMRRHNGGELPGITLGAIERLFKVAQWRVDLGVWRKLRLNPLVPAETRDRLVEVVERHTTPKRRGTRVERLAVDAEAIEDTSTRLADPEGRAA
jgi:hypothetical protein